MQKKPEEINIVLVVVAFVVVAVDGDQTYIYIRTNRPTDTPSYRDARTQLKKEMPRGWLISGRDESPSSGGEQPQRTFDSKSRHSHFVR